MASSQLVRWDWEETIGPPPGQIMLWRSLDTRFAQEAGQQRALTKAMVDESRQAAQFQLDSISQTFQEMLDSHSKNAERSMEAACQQLRKDLQDQQGATLQRLEKQVQEAAAGERLAVTEALQSVAEVLRRERTRRDPDGRPGAGPTPRPAAPAEATFVTRSHLADALSALREEMRHETLAALAAPAARPREPQRPAGSSRDGPPADGPESATAEPQRPVGDGPPAGGPSSAQANGGFGEPGARPCADLEARVAQLERLARAAESPDANSAESPDAAGGGPEAAPPTAGAGGGSELVLAEGGEGSAGALAAGGEVALGESMWDAAAFIGCSEAGTCASLFTMLALSVSILIQIVFILIVNDSLTPAHITEETVEEYELWRTTIAHNVKFVDDLSYRSLARKVCNFKDAPMSSGAIEGFASISAYLGVRDQEKEYRDAPPLGESPLEGLLKKFSTAPGTVMCNMALTVWFFTVSKEIFSIARVAHAFILLPSGKTTISESSDGLALLAVSGLRRGMFYGVILVRSLVCLALGLCGALYLAATISLGDLLLNAVALEVVISLPELVFQVLAPSSIRALISLLAPLPRPPAFAWRGLDARPVVAFLAIVAGLFAVWTIKLEPQYELLVEARKVLCDGDLDVIASTDANGIVVAFSQPDWYEPVDIKSLYSYRAVREIILNGVPDENAIFTEGAMVDTVYGYAGSRFTVQGRAASDTESMTHWLNSFCVDMDGNDSVIWSVLSDVFESALKLDGVEGLGPFTSCSDVAWACQWDTSASVRARQFCPVTCGCDDPTSELILFAPVHGCPQKCADTESANQALGDMDCADWTSEAPRTLYGVDLMEAYLAGLYQVVGWPEDVIHFVVLTMNFSLVNGNCSELTSAVGDAAGLGNLCTSSNPYGLRPITAICPMSCGCQSSNAVLCPTTC